MSSLQQAEAPLRQYIQQHALSEIYEALLCGLLVMCPEDPLTFLEEKIKELIANGPGSISWNAFVDESQRPKLKTIAESYLEYLFGSEDGQLLSPELFDKAYTFYINNIQKMCFDAWVNYRFLRKRCRVDFLRKMKRAERHFTSRKLRTILHRWNDWVHFRKRQHTLAAMKIQKAFNEALLKRILKAWLAEAQDSKKTREYFERLERGELEDGSDLSSSPAQEGKDEVSLLPQRAVLRIFSYVDIIDLARCAQVCRSWKIITQTSSLWSSIDFATARHKIQDKIVVNILQKCRPYVIRLNLRSCSSLHWPSFKSISECKNLQDLNVSECEGLNDESMRVISEGCPALLYLNLSYTDITNGTLRMLSRCLPNLQYLSLAHCRKFTDRGLQYLATGGKGCRKLIYLDLSGCTQISVDGFKFVASGCSSLQHLKIDDMVTLTDSCIMVLLEKCQQIVSISLLGSPHLSDAAFKAIFQSRKLSKIRIEGNNRITDASFKLLSKHCPNLSHMYMADCQKITDNSLKAMSSMKYILILNVADCIRISDPGIRNFLEGSSGAKIRELNLTNCIRVSDISLLRISQRCHRLTYLSLRYCENVTDSGIELLGNMDSLISIDISGTSISDQKFCQQAKDVERLDISHCLHVSNQTLKTLAFCCHSITSLNIAGCPKMTDVSIQYLTSVCRYLHILDISGCVHLSDRVLKYVQKSCKQLRVLKMLYCRSITKSAVMKLEARVQKTEYNNADPPLWFGYDRQGNLLNSRLKQEHDLGNDNRDLIQLNERSGTL
ncbi:F-box and leucine-rich repeat protein 13 isoform X2 [Ambystoma mexicanum]|uniref:F-box and leucine-rich repeat protein 13 isoform X2 n=1 Tax=Ambystoma mexicanum TaxID=8296 RepID=UPI0037E97076